VASRALVAVGAVVPLVVWCIASPWTFAAALAVGCWAGGSAGRAASTRIGRGVSGRLAEVVLLDVRQWQPLRLVRRCCWWTRLSACRSSSMTGSAGGPTVGT
jgi:hypothetical protein